MNIATPPKDFNAETAPEGGFRGGFGPDTRNAGRRRRNPCLLKGNGLPEGSPRHSAFAFEMLPGSQPATAPGTSHQPSQPPGIRGSRSNDLRKARRAASGAGEGTGAGDAGSRDGF